MHPCGGQGDRAEVLVQRDLVISSCRIEGVGITANKTILSYN